MGGDGAGGPGRGPAVEAVDVSTYVIPTDAPESDGTLEWDRTTLVVVEISAGGVRGLGYTYASVATAAVVREHLAKLVVDGDVFAIGAINARMLEAIRNLGRSGIVATAISAVDTALWDAKARLLGLPLAVALGFARPGVPAYGSGGFTSYTVGRLQEQLGGWAEQGMKLVKMKVGRGAPEDPGRVHAARSAIGERAGLLAQAGARARRSIRRRGRALVRGAGQLGRSGGAAPDPRSRAGRDGDRRRRVRLRSVLLSPHARGGRGRRAAG
jgi:L-alanine-DL-glutamate epimerase-like enolase superfamily enzyme